MGLAGFDFQALNRKYLAQPSNDAANYAVSIIPAGPGTAWRCIGIYHLKPSENNGRHNVFVEVLDEAGNRTRQPQIAFAECPQATHRKEAWLFRLALSMQPQAEPVARFLQCVVRGRPRFAQLAFYWLWLQPVDSCFDCRIGSSVHPQPLAHTIDHAPPLPAHILALPPGM